jgi:hypothetical protein
MRALAMYGGNASLEKRELRRVPLPELLALMDTAGSWQAFASGVRAYDATGQQTSAGPRLPDVIWSVGDLDVMIDPPLRPTFVGSRVAIGRTQVVEKRTSVRSGELAGAIVAMETADPGYDWLFGHRFSGLVTAYGGEFSHMGLRCGEFGIPAALGLGPVLFGIVAGANELRLDPVNGEVWAGGRRVVPA